MDYRRGYDYQDSMMYGRENQNFRGQMPYGRENQMMNRPYGFDNWGQMSYNPFFEDRDDAEDERDLAYMREMHPEQVRTIMRHVEELCDRMDYEGSMMYDEYPDQLSLMKKSREIWKLAQEREQFGEAAPEWEQMQDLIGVLLLQEMLRRRKRQRMRGGSGILFGK